MGALLSRFYRPLWAVAAVAAAWWIVRLPTSMAVALLLGGLLLAAMVREPLVGVGAALVITPWGAWLAAYRPAIPWRLGDWVLALALALWGLGLLAVRAREIPWPPLATSLLPFLGVATLTLYAPADRSVALLEWMKWGELLLVAWCAYARLLRVEGGMWLLAGALAALLLFQALIGLWQFALRGDGPPAFLIREGVYRAYGTFEQPNPFGGLMGMGTAFFAGMAAALWKARRRSAGGLAALVALVSGAALLASWSRGAWMGFAAALPVMMVALPRRRWRGLLFVLLLAAAAGWLYAQGLLPAALRERLTGFLAYTRFQDVRGMPITSENFAVVERMAHWQAALEMWRTHFWLGTGLGTYEAVYRDYALINWPLPLGHAHNFYLTLLAETGLLGLTTYLFFLTRLFTALWRALPRLEGERRALAVGLLGLWTHFVVHDGVDNLMVNGVQLTLGVALALSAWVVASARRVR